VKEGEGKNKGIRGDGGSTWSALEENGAWFLTPPRMIIFSSLSCISHLLLRHSEASFKTKEKRGKQAGGWVGGREGGREVGGVVEAAESRGRRER